MILSRCCGGLCPRCGGPGLFKGDPSKPDQMPRLGFRLRRECPYCGFRLQEESGLTLGTTVVGYVLVVVVVLVPLLLAVLFDWVGVWTGVTIGIIGSFALPALLYPYLLRVVLAAWFGFHPDAFEQNEESIPPQYPPES